jgi:antitoxin ParD1/3/4
MYDIVIQEAKMGARANKPVSVTLGPLAERVEARVRSGAYASASEVVRAGLRALDREEALLDSLFEPIDESDPRWIAYIREKIAEADADPRPPVPAEEAFARLDAFIAARKAKREI